MPAKVISELVDFASYFVGKLDEYIIDENKQPAKREIMKTEVQNFRSEVTGQGIGYGTNKVIIEDWIMVITEYLFDIVKKDSVLQEMSSSIEKKYADNLKKMKLGLKVNLQFQIQLWLEGFLQRILYEHVEKKVSNERLMEYAAKLKAELDLLPIQFKSESMLYGIFPPETKKIQVSDNIALRKITKQDLEAFINFSLPSQPGRITVYPSAIMEVTLRDYNESVISNLENALLATMRLYKLGSIFSLFTRRTKDTVLWGFNIRTSGGFVHFSKSDKYEINDFEIDKFVDFINTFLNIFKHQLAEKEYLAISIALNRYYWSLLETTDIDRKLLYAIMGLEPLFTIGDERGEHSYKISLRIAQFLSCIGFNSFEVREKMEEAYRFRNKVVHGREYQKDWKKEINLLLPIIKNYLRISIILFSLNIKEGKDNLTKLIDRSIMKEEEYANLKKLISKDFERFKESLEYKP